jgi:hypothetical protein
MAEELGHSMTATDTPATGLKFENNQIIGVKLYDSTGAPIAGAGDATAANQALQLTQETTTNTKLEDVKTLIGTTNTKLTSIDTGVNATTARTPGRSIVTTSGTVAAGKKSVTFYNSGTTDVTVLGVTLGAKEKTGYSVDGKDTLGALAYDATGGTLVITTLT